MLKVPLFHIIQRPLLKQKLAALYNGLQTDKVLNLTKSCLHQIFGVLTKTCCTHLYIHLAFFTPLHARFGENLRNIFKYKLFFAIPSFLDKNKVNK